MNKYIVVFTQVVIILALQSCKSTENITPSREITLSKGLSSNTFIVPTDIITRTSIATIIITKTYSQTITSTKLFVPSQNYLIGTRWNVISFTVVFHIEFQEYGVLSVMDRWYISKNDSWEINGYLLILSMDNGYAIYEGKFIDKDNIIGTAKNQKGSKWYWRASRDYN